MTQYKTIASLIVMLIGYSLEKFGGQSMDSAATEALVEGVANLMFWGGVVGAFVFKLVANRRESVLKEEVADVKEEAVEAKIEAKVAKEMAFPADLKPFTGNLGDKLAGFDRFATWAKARGINEDELDDFREQLLNEMKGTGNA